MLETKNEASPRAVFSSALFNDADADDLLQTDEALRSRIAENAYEFFSERAPGEQKLRLYDISSSNGEDTVTVIEAINDDMPFLVSSALAEIVDLGLTVRMASHPIYRTQRNDKGEITQLSAGTPSAIAAGQPESLIHFQVDAITDQKLRDELRNNLEDIFRQVKTVVQDWQPMVSRLRGAIDRYVTMPPPVAVDELAESVHFLKWLVEGNFTLLGMREYQFSLRNGTPHLETSKENSLGLLRDPELRVLRREDSDREMGPIAQEFYKADAPLIVATANFISPVQRRVPVTSIGIKLYAADGKLTGELRMVGLFSSTAYNQPVGDIPFLRHKAEKVMRALGHGQTSHSGRVLTNIIETFPRDDLFQITGEELIEICTKLVRLELMPRTCVIIRYDEFRRYASVLVYVRRDRFTTQVRERIIGLLEERFEARMTNFTPLFSIGPLVRLHVIIWRYDAPITPIAERSIEREVQDIVRTWTDDLRHLIRASFGRNASEIARRYGEAFPPGYEHATTPDRALTDIRKIEQLTDEKPVGIDFFREHDVAGHMLNVMLYQLHEPISLSRRVPVFENFGFSVVSEETYNISVRHNGERTSIFLHNLLLEAANGQPVPLNGLKSRLEECFIEVWRGTAGNDPFNRLILEAGLNWREAALLRAYCSYLRQIGTPFGMIYLAQTLARHSGIARDLALLFHRSFDPGMALPAPECIKQAKPVSDRIISALAKVSSLDEDRIIRHIVNLIYATLRTNFYQEPTELTGGPTIALKIKSEKVEGMPSPKPFAEIFVTSPRYEGVHLRGGRIARGGLRWSDRHQDFRTEVLGLAKAQQVKNSIIVPQGAKGGFVPRSLPPMSDREAYMAEGIACYRSFIASLLSVTDNLKEKQVIPPADTVRYDNDDPYLVVAADKGTATFSDIANELAVSHNFWLGDAFASGGSAGYDHKKMGITARGAWEAVKRHFREMNVDTQTTPFTVIGVGDMSGDVFGNGMLLSRKICLLGAFDHREIFMDPSPDPEATWEERKRLFDLPRSSWKDYNRDLISEGGGVFSRSAKSIPLSDQMRRMLKVSLEHAAPNELIRLLLKAEADFLWFGGIGTYVRASDETNEQVNDRTNDAIRITASELGVKVIAEGANLGMTQEARIEFDLNGGRINTDAIDNSAGVNSSDMEVNIKIALAPAVEKGMISLDERNALLVRMTNEVAESILKNNYLQTLAISLGERRGLGDLEFQNRLMIALERSVELDRDLESLPSATEIGARIKRRQPLTRPELAVLLAYSKIALYSEIVDSSLIDDPYLSRVLADYFPKTMRDQFTDEIETHTLRREIISTMLTNAIINRGGSTFIVRLKEQTGRDARTIALAFAATMGVFRLSEFFSRIDALDGNVDGQRQLALYMLLQDILRHQTAWFIRYGDFSEGLSSLIDRYRSGIDNLAASIDTLFDEWLTERLEQSQKSLMTDDVSEEIARRFAVLKALSDGPDIISLAIRMERDEIAIGRVYYAASSYFRMDELRARSQSDQQPDYYTRIAIGGTLNAAAAAIKAITQQVFETEVDGDGEAGFERWRSAREADVDRARNGIDEILDGGDLTLAKLTVAVAQLREIAEN
jgi:glutamate dehydrogenase